MWRRTPARFKKSPRLERCPVAVQLTQTKRVTPPDCGSPHLAGPESGPALDAITATSNKTRRQVIAFRGKVVGQTDLHVK